MALPGSGPISWEMIRAEFGGGYPIYASQYYRGAGLVPDVPANYGVPTSGPLYASQFYNAVKATPFQASLSPSWLMGSWPQNTSGTISRSFTVSCSGGTGNYSVISRTVDGGASISGSGLGGTVTASGRNTSRMGTFTVVVTDGVTQITLSGSYEYSFGTPL
ncbi:hypothetical protein [Stenotrophomonas maltophilia]|uniref:hypothetical protein n=1 Tax=Stenotrophomonas maltophilia TaxID=40324 RepID=UPI00131154D8|nr:hypothetical protein [Stenotrophomonas maltophilia]